MTDDSHPAQRGGGPLREDADATAQVVQHTAAANAPDADLAGPPAGGETPVQRTDPAHPSGPPPTPAPITPPDYGPPPAPPVYYPGQGTAPPAPANRVASGTPGGYGPFHNTTTPGTPPPGAGPAYAAPPGTPTSGAGPAYAAPPTPTGFGYEETPTSTPPNWSATDPISGGALTPDPYGFSVAPAGPRIEPTPKQPKSRLLLPALAGLLAGLVIFGTGGWFLGRSTAADPAPAPTRTTPAPTAGALPPYEQNQVAINQPKFTGALAPVAQGWLAQLSGCSRSGEKGGPVLNKGEKARVRCEMDAMSVIFVEYATVADRDKAAVKTLGQAVDARTLTPGAGAATRKATPSGRTNGNYVEYAYQASGRTVSGIWWDDSATPVAAYLLAYWKEGTGQKWEPMRDVWARYA